MGLKIAREYLLPELLANVGLKNGDVNIGREELNFLCQRCGVPMEEGGVRGIKQALEAIVLHINQLVMLQEDEVELDENKHTQQKADDGEQKQKADGEQRAE